MTTAPWSAKKTTQQLDSTSPSDVTTVGAAPAHASESSPSSDTFNNYADAVGDTLLLASSSSSLLNTHTLFRTVYSTN